MAEKRSNGHILATLGKIYPELVFQLCKKGKEGKGWAGGAYRTSCPRQRGWFCGDRREGRWRAPPGSSARYQGSTRPLHRSPKACPTLHSAPRWRPLERTPIPTPQTGWWWGVTGVLWGRGGPQSGGRGLHLTRGDSRPLLRTRKQNVKFNWDG